MNKTGSFPIFFILIIVLLLTSVDKYQQVSTLLSKKTIGDYKIIIYSDSSVIQQFAAQELQHYLKAIFKVSPNIISKKKLKKTDSYFLLGEGFLLDSLQLPDTLQKDSFIKAFRKKNIYLGGKDDLDALSVKENFFQRDEKANFGTLYAVYDFLENNLGIHWFFPTHLGEFIPNDSIYSFEPILIQRRSFFNERTFGKSLFYDEDTLFYWMIRNKVSFLKNPTNYQHNWQLILPSSKYFASNPEIYAEQNGKRVMFNKMGKSAQLCTTNPKTIELFLENIKDFLSKHNNCTNLSLSPNDGDEFCECRNCTNLDTIINISSRRSCLSNRIFTFYRILYDSINKYYPELNVGGLAYDKYCAAPRNVDLPKNFNIRLAFNDFGFYRNKCSKLDTLIRIIESWKTKKNVGFYSFPYGSKWVYPFLNTEDYQKIVVKLVENNIRSIKLYFYPDWYTQGLDIWIITKMYWEPNISIDSLKNLFYNDIFPKSNQVIRKFHSELIENINKLDLCDDNYSSYNIVRIRQIFLKLFQANFLKENITQVNNCLNRSNLGDKESHNLSNFKEILNFLLREQNAYLMYQILHVYPTKIERDKFIQNLRKLKNSLCLTNNSNYYDSQKSPSIFLIK